MTLRPLALLLLPAALLLSSCTQQGQDIDLTDLDVRISFLHTSDIHSRLLPYEMNPQFTDQQLGLLPENGPYGGAARIKTIADRERARAGRMLHVDSGDCFQGAPIFNFFEGEPEIRAMAAIGVDVAVVGNHEFDAGAHNYAEQLEGWSSFYSVAANYDFDDPTQPWNNQLQWLTDPYAIINADGLRVGIIGMANLSSISSIGQGDNSLDVRADGTLWAVSQYARWLEPQVDLVAVVSHLGLHSDEDIARFIPEVDIIFGGHLHVAIDPPVVIENEIEVGKRIPVVHSGAFAKYVGRVDLVVRNGDIITWDYELIPVDATIPEDPEMVDLLLPYQQEMERQQDLSEVLGNATEIVRRFGADGGDSPLGNVVARSMQFFPGIETDFAMTNSLGMRTDIQEGPITSEQMFNVLPFENSITTMFLPGTEVQALFDYVTRRSAGRGCNSQAQISGARFVMNCGTGLAEDVTIGGSWAACDAATPCPDGEVCVGGQCGLPIDLNTVYELATNDYIAGGGSGFEVLERNTTQEDRGVSIRDAVIRYIRNHPELPGDIAVSDGRITPVF